VVFEVVGFFAGMSLVALWPAFAAATHAHITSVLAVTNRALRI
jgi:uncharacterized membrane protein